jgi:hypothetical protein
MLWTKGVRKSGTYAHGVPVKQKHKKGGYRTRQGIRNWYIRTAKSKVVQAVTVLTRTGVLFSITPVARYFQSDCECYTPSPQCVSETGYEFQATRPKSLFGSVCDTHVNSSSKNCLRKLTRKCPNLQISANASSNGFCFRQQENTQKTGTQCGKPGSNCC